MTGIAKSGIWLDGGMDHRMKAAVAVATEYYNQNPRLLKFVLSKPPDRVNYSNLRLAKAEFEEIEALALEAGILKQPIAFDDYADTSLLREHDRRRRLSLEGSDLRTAGELSRIARRHALVSQPGRYFFRASLPPVLRVTRAGFDRLIDGGDHEVQDRIVLLPLAVAICFVLGWDLAVRVSGSDIFPTPKEVLAGMVELARKGLLLKYIVASLFRVTWGFMLAVLVGVPAGLLLGWFGRARAAFNPLLQVLRPISPIAWIPRGDPLVRRLRRGARSS